MYHHLRRTFGVTLCLLGLASRRGGPMAARSIQSQCEDKHTWMSSEMAPMH